MDDKEKVISVADMTKQDTKQEIRTLDSIMEPRCAINRQTTVGRMLPFRVTSAGIYQEGGSFRNTQGGILNFCLLLTLGGTGCLSYHGETRLLRRGDAAFVNNQCMSETKCEGGIWRFCIINLCGISCEYYEKLWNGEGLRILTCSDVGKAETTVQTVIDLLERSNLEDELLINWYVTDLLTRFVLQNVGEYGKELAGKHNLQWVNEAEAYLSAHCTEAVCMADLAARLYLDPAYFSHTFHEKTGYTPKQYQINCRMDRVAVLLTQTGLGIAQISEQTGFSSPAQLSRQFCRLYGMPPKVYRRKKAGS